MMEQRIQDAYRNTIILIMSVLVALIFLEIAVRLYDDYSGHGFFSSHRNLLKKPYRPLRPFKTFGPDLYKYKNNKKFISSRYGELYPLKKGMDTYRIVVFGGSTTENYRAYQSEKIHFPLLLQKKLQKEYEGNIEIINIANSGYATPHSIILLELDVISWEPDLVILSHNINDLNAAYWSDFTFDYSNKYGHSAFLPNYKELYTLSNLLFENSELYWFVRELFSKAFVNKGIKRREYGDKPPKVALGVFMRNIKTFVNIAKSNEIKVILGNQPLLDDEDFFFELMPTNRVELKVTYPLHSEFIQHHAVYNASIQNVANETGVMFINNADILSNQRENFIDYVHYTPIGVHLLADNYVHYFLINHIIPLNIRK